MNLDEIKALSNNEIGRALDSYLKFDERPEFHFVSYEDICTKLDEVAKVEKIIIEKGLGKAYTHNLQKLYDDEIENATYGGRDLFLATCSARCRATAVWMTIQNI